MNAFANEFIPIGKQQNNNPNKPANNQQNQRSLTPAERKFNNNKKKNKQKTQNNQTNNQSSNSSPKNNQTNNTSLKNNQTSSFSPKINQPNNPSAKNNQTNNPSSKINQSPKNNQTNNPSPIINKLKKLTESISDRFDRLIEDYQAICLGEATQEEMSKKEEIYREICQLMEKLNYPYNGLYQFCGKVFDKYLRYKGINDPALLIDIPYIIEAAIADNTVMFDWNLFINKLTLCNYDFPYRELYLERVNNFRYMIDAYKLDFVDHRLERAIINLQRHIKKKKTNKHK